MSRIGKLLSNPVRSRMLSVPLLLMFVAPAFGDEAQPGNNQQPPGHSHPIQMKPGHPKFPGPTNNSGQSGGPPQYCTCPPPKGYSLTKGDADELCFNKRIACTCTPPGSAPVKSDQPVCLYKLIPTPR